MILLFIFLIVNEPKLAVDSAVAICKNKNTLRVDYMSSHYGISDIKSKIKSDTLSLTIFISQIQNNSFNISIPQNTHVVSYGKMTRKIAELENCVNVLSGKDALDYLKKNQ